MNSIELTEAAYYFSEDQNSLAEKVCEKMYPQKVFSFLNCVEIWYWEDIKLIAKIKFRQTTIGERLSILLKQP